MPPHNAFMMSRAQTMLRYEAVVGGKSAIDHPQLVNWFEMKMKEHYSAELVQLPYPFNLSLPFSCSNKHPIIPRHSSAEHLLPRPAICLYGW